MSRNIVDYIGDPVLLYSAKSTAITSAALSASDCLAGVSVKGIDQVVFLVSIGETTAEGAAWSVQIQYSSTGNASDAATSNATMSCTDAILSFTTAAAYVSAGIKTLMFDVAAKSGMDDSVGKLFALITPSSVAFYSYAVAAIPVTGTYTLPVHSPTVTADD